MTAQKYTCTHHRPGLATHVQDLRAANSALAKELARKQREATGLAAELAGHRCAVAAAAASRRSASCMLTCPRRLQLGRCDDVTQQVAER